VTRSPTDATTAPGCPYLLADAPARDGGFMLVTEVPDERVQPAQGGDVPTEMLAQPAELLLGARRRDDARASLQQRLHDEGTHVARGTGDDSYPTERHRARMRGT
jgi:hypothetical protein